MNSRRFALIMAVEASATMILILLWMLSVPGSRATAMPAPPLSNASAPRYVCITGTNSGDCTDRRSPCRTVQYAVSFVAASKANAGLRLTRRSSGKLAAGNSAASGLKTNLLAISLPPSARYAAHIRR